MFKGELTICDLQLQRLHRIVWHSLFYVEHILIENNTLWLHNYAINQSPRIFQFCCFTIYCISESLLYLVMAEKEKYTIKWTGVSCILHLCLSTSVSVSFFLVCVFVCYCACVSYLGPHWQGCIEGLDGFVKLPAEVVEHSEPRLQIRVDAVRVVLNCFQKELLDLW